MNTGFPSIRFRKNRIRPSARRAAVWLGCCLLLFPPAHSFGEDSSRDSRQSLLEQSLSIHEIDEELQRLKQQELEISRQLEDIERQIAFQEQQVGASRSHAGQTLRAYYTGERDAVWLLLLSMKSLPDALSALEYLTMILDNDRRSLNAYLAGYAQLQQSKAELQEMQSNLQKVKSNYLFQKARVIALQKARDEQLAREKDAEGIRRQSEQLIRDWSVRGLPLFRSYLDATARAMNHLPEILQHDRGGSLSLSGLSAVFTITDRELNDFLRSQDPLLGHVTFTFGDHAMTVTGKDQDLEITMKGNYQLEEKDGKNYITFHIDYLNYNGFKLPDTTGKALERDFDLGFSPDSFSGFLEATGLIMEKGRLTVNLKIKF